MYRSSLATTVAFDFELIYFLTEPRKDHIELPNVSSHIYHMHTHVTGSNIKIKD